MSEKLKALAPPHVVAGKRWAGRENKRENDKGGEGGLSEKLKALAPSHPSCW